MFKTILLISALMLQPQYNKSLKQMRHTLKPYWLVTVVNNYSPLFIMCQPNDRGKRSFRFSSSFTKMQNSSCSRIVNITWSCSCFLIEMFAKNQQQLYEYMRQAIHEHNGIAMFCYYKHVLFLIKLIYKKTENLPIN